MKNNLQNEKIDLYSKELSKNFEILIQDCWKKQIVNKFRRRLYDDVGFLIFLDDPFEIILKIAMEVYQKSYFTSRNKDISFILLFSMLEINGLKYNHNTKQLIFEKYLKLTDVWDDYDEKDFIKYIKKIFKKNLDINDLNFNFTKSSYYQMVKNTK